MTGILSRVSDGFSAMPGSILAGGFMTPSSRCNLFSLAPFSSRGAKQL
jgi:hypothetical protein